MPFSVVSPKGEGDQECASQNYEALVTPHDSLGPKGYCWFTLIILGSTCILEAILCLKS